MKTLLEIAATLLKVAGLFGVFGYISLRAHLNILGVPWNTPLGLERYLAETYQLALAVLAPILPYIPTLIAPLILVSAVMAVLMHLLSRSAVRYRRMDLIREQITSRFAGLKHTGLVPLILALVTTPFYSLILRDVGFARTANLVGPLTGTSYYQMPEVFTTMVLSCLAIWIIYGWLGESGSDTVSVWVRLCWWLALTSAGLLLFYAPVVYGTLWHPMAYPAIKISMKGSKSIQCGVLILKTDSEFLVWQANRLKGELMTIPTAGIYASVATTNSDLRKWAEEAIEGKSSPDCSQISDPPAEHQ